MLTKTWLTLGNNNSRTILTDPKPILINSFLSNSYEEQQNKTFPIEHKPNSANVFYSQTILLTKTLLSLGRQ